MYLLTEWEGRTGKYLARGQGVRTERTYVLTESQIFSRPAEPYSVNKYILLYLLVSTHAVISQLSGPYSPVRPAKIKVNSVAKLFCDLSPSVLNFHCN